MEGGDGSEDRDVFVVVPVVKLLGGDGGAGFCIDDKQAGHIFEVAEGPMQGRRKRASNEHAGTG